MKKNKKIIAVATAFLFFSALVVFLLLFDFSSDIERSLGKPRQAIAEDTLEPDTSSYREAKRIAEEWVKERSPTFTQTGIYIESIRGKEVDGGLMCRNCYTFDVKFLDRTPGYGSSRTEEQLNTRVVTEHTMQIDVKNNTVTSAIIDRVYDEIADIFLER